MMISTRGRYALRVMVDLAEQDAGSYIPLKDIAQRQDISRKYLESIMTILSKAGFVDAIHGKGGGFRLNRPPKEYSVAGILDLTEKTLAPVACLEHGAQPCQRAAVCKTLPMWRELDRLVGDYLEGVTLADLAECPATADYII